MKRIILFFSFFLMCCVCWSQKLITPSELIVVYATSDDGFLNVREAPSSKARILGTLPLCFHGLGRGILLESGERWSKVKIENDIVGWVYNKVSLNSLPSMLQLFFIRIIMLMTVPSISHMAPSVKV